MCGYEGWIYKFLCYRKTFIFMQNTDTTDFSSTASSSSHVTPLPIPPRGRGASCGQLFSILLELPIPQWASSYYVSCWDHLQKIIFIMTYNVQFAFYKIVVCKCHCMDSNTERMHYSTLLHTYNKLATYCMQKIGRSQMVSFLIAGHIIEICWLLHITIATCTYTFFLHATPNHGIVRGDRGSSVVSTATKIVRSRFRNSTCDESTPYYICILLLLYSVNPWRMWTPVWGFWPPWLKIARKKLYWGQ
jgi:hypothetical protein